MFNHVFSLLLIMTVLLPEIGYSNTPSKLQHRSDTKFAYIFDAPRLYT